MSPASPQHRTVLVGRGGGIARAVALAVRAAGATVIVAGRDAAVPLAVDGGEPLV